MSEMTPTQGRYLSFIQEYILGYGLPPAEIEIAEAMGVAPPSVHQMLKTLQKKGLIQRQPGVARSIEILVPTADIPEWTGKRLTRSVKTRIIVGQWISFDTPPSNPQMAVYRFKITLDGTSPPIWRRIETQDITLKMLHELIQAAMGWSNSHLHHFEIAGKIYADSHFMMEEPDVIDYGVIRISKLLARHGSKLRMLYHYDFGDDWQHTVVLEKVTESEPGVTYPRCVAGAQACPPEDIGGIFGFEEYIEAITDPNHNRYREFLDEYGPLETGRFDPEQATQSMRQGRSRR